MKQASKDTIEINL